MKSVGPVISPGVPVSAGPATVTLCSGVSRRANASAVAASHWSALARIGSSRSRSASTGTSPSASGAPCSCSRSRVASSSSIHRVGRSSRVTPCSPSGGTTWLPGGSSTPSVTSRMCGVAGRSSAPKRGRSLRSWGSSAARSPSEVVTIRIGPTASVCSWLRACGSHFTQSQWARCSSEDSTATTRLSGDWKAVAEQMIGAGQGAGLLLLAADLDPVEGAQVDRGGQVGLGAVHDEQAVQRGGGRRVDVVDRGALGWHELEGERLGAQRRSAPAGRRLSVEWCSQTRVRSSARAGSADGVGVVPGQRPPLLGGGLAGDLADAGEVAEVLGARAGDLLGALLTLPVDLDDDEADRGEQEHAGREEAAAAAAAGARRPG